MAGIQREAEVYQPVHVGIVELAGHLPSTGDLTIGGRQATRARILVTLFSEPLGEVSLTITEGRIEPDALRLAVRAKFGEALTSRLAAVGAVEEDLLTGSERLDVNRSPWLRSRNDILRYAPTMSVVTCTRGRNSSVLRLLSSLTEVEYPSFEVIVVENVPMDDQLRQAVHDRAEVPALWVPEPRPGLSWARNRGLATANGDIVCFVDDDELVDRFWLAELARGFAASDDVACVTGMILPASLESPVEDFYEQFGGHSKGRGFEQQIFDVSSHVIQHPLYPLPPFGAGGNMSFRRDIIKALGGFDVALGSGTPAGGCEDTAAIADVMLAGHTVVYQPSAYVRHYHRQDYSALGDQMERYGSGLTAFYCRSLLRHPAECLQLLPLFRRASRDLRGDSDVQRSAMSESFPSALRRRQRLGMLKGPVRYVQSECRQRAIRKAFGE